MTRLGNLPWGPLFWFLREPEGGGAPNEEQRQQQLRTDLVNCHIANARAFFLPVSPNWFAFFHERADAFISVAGLH